MFCLLRNTLGYQYIYRRQIYMATLQKIFHSIFHPVQGHCYSLFNNRGQQNNGSQTLFQIKLTKSLILTSRKMIKIGLTLIKEEKSVSQFLLLICKKNTQQQQQNNNKKNTFILKEEESAWRFSEPGSPLTLYSISQALKFPSED